MNPQGLLAITGPVTPTEMPATPTESENLLRRIAEIKAMDKSTLSASEKKQLRKELRDMKRQERAVTRGVYLSLGAIIIIVLLLILIL